MTLRNRIVSAPMERNYCNPDGTLTTRYIDYLEERAKGGAALVYTEATYVSQSGKARPRQLGLSRDDHIRGLAQLAARIHAHGSLLGVQLMHGGRAATRRVSGVLPVAPSVVPLDRPFADLPVELTTTQCAELIADFGRSAERAHRAGVDVISIHGAHGYLVHSFMSPLTNRREDRYADPTVFLSELLDAVIAGASGTPVGIRISAFEGNPGGLNTEQQLAIFEAARPSRLDFVDISAGNYESPQWMTQSGEFPRGGLAQYAEPYRRFGIPVGVAGHIADPETAQKILDLGQADYVELARALHADPEAASRWIEGADYRPCIACNQCSDDLGVGAVRCTVNAWVGGGRPRLPEVSTSLRVLVVGAGPAGLESARLAAIEGHRVEVVDANETIGGRFRLAARLVGVPQYSRILGWYERELARLGVTVTLNTRLDAHAIAERKPDTVLVATGAESAATPAIDANHRSVTVEEWLETLPDLPEFATILGDDREALAVAYHLARAGRGVRVISEGEELGSQVGSRAKILSEPFVAASPLVERIDNSQVVSIDLDDVVIVDSTGASRRLGAPGVVMTSYGVVPDRRLARELMTQDASFRVVEVSQHGHDADTFLDAMMAARMAVVRVAELFA